MVFFPKSKKTLPIVDIFLTAYAILYVVNLIPGVAEILPIVLKPTLPAVSNLFSSPEGALGAWTQCVLCDVLIGRWIMVDNLSKGQNRLMAAPFMFLSLLFGPVGFLSYKVRLACLKK